MPAARFRSRVLPGANFVRDLEEFIATKGAFLRIRGSFFTPSHSRDASGTLTFLVHGLPVSRRAKLHVPLRIGMSKILDAGPYHAFFKRGHVFVKGTTDQDRGFCVHVNFVGAGLTPGCLTGRLASRCAWSTIQKSDLS